jgi:hypothetical protein
MVVEGIVLRDGEEEVLLDIFFLWAPDLLTMFIDDSVLMGVVGDGGGTRWGSKEVREELSFWGKREWEVGEDESRWGRGGNNGNGGFSNGWWEILYWDVSEWDILNNLFELEMDIGILVLRG